MKACFVDVDDDDDDGMMSEGSAKVKAFLKDDKVATAQQISTFGRDLCWSMFVENNSIAWKRNRLPLAYLCDL